MMQAAPFPTLPAMLRHQASVRPESAAFRFRDTPCSFAELWDGITRIAGHLAALGVERGDRVVVVIPNGPEFFFAFYGAQLAGAIAVPLYPGFGAATILSYADACQARVAIVPSDVPQAQLTGFSDLAAARKVVVATFGTAAATTASGAFPDTRASDPAFIQYTSGSTGAPKGVLISHENLFTNMRQMIAGMQITADDIFVSWLPVYHDMGLILKTMVPFLLGCELHLLPTDLNDVTRWLTTIEATGGTFTAAPDFAYRLCLRRVRDPASIDITSLRVALNAAEPVRADTIAAFERTFSLKDVMVAGYGLAEATVGVAMWPPKTPPRVDDMGNVSVGRPFPGVEVEIVDGDAPVSCGTVGEIVVQSAALPVGYFRNDAANAALFWRPGWARTGDLGYVDDDGHLFIVGRKKNVIKQLGRNIFPQEVERVADGHPEVRYSAAVGIDRGRLEGEQVYLFAEVKEPEAKDKAALDAIVIAIVRAINDALGFRPGRVYLLRPKAIPMTHNGKLQHDRLKKMYLSRELGEHILHPPA